MYLAIVTDFMADLSSISFRHSERKKEGLWEVGVVKNKVALFEATCTW